MLSKNQLGKFKRPEELVWGPASLLRAICEHTVGDLSSVNSRHLYLLQKKLFPQFFAPRNFVFGVVKYFLVWFTRENAFCKCAQSRSVSFLWHHDRDASLPLIWGFKYFSKHNQNFFFIVGSCEDFGGNLLLVLLDLYITSSRKVWHTAFLK